MPLRTLLSSSSFEEERVRLTNLSNPQDVDRYCFAGRQRCNGALSVSEFRGMCICFCFFVCVVNLEAVTLSNGLVLGCFHQMKRLEILRNFSNSFLKKQQVDQYLMLTQQTVNL